MVYCEYTYAALLVQGCCTLGARVLHSFGMTFFHDQNMANLLVLSTRYLQNSSS